MRKRILVCDDDPLLLDIVKFRLSARDFDVEVAADGAEALSKIGASLPDAIVLDAMMPVMDGQQVLRRLKSDPQTASVPVIMLSARKQETDVLGALEDGANEYMVKPFSPDELIIRLSRLLERKS